MRKLALILSAAAPAPIKWAITTSRTKPNTRDTSVIPLTIMPDFKSRLLKIFFSTLKFLPNCIEISFLRYILREKTVKIPRTSFGEPV